MSVYYCIPSKRPPEEAEKCLRLWRERGYKLSIVRDAVDLDPLFDADLTWFSEPIWGGYPGYSIATNYAVKQALEEDSTCDFVVCGGDDIEPDLNHSAEEIARQCSEHFRSVSGLDCTSTAHWERIETFGVMQPTGDRWGDRQGPYIERVCGSPWIGREFALRINQGKGPLWPQYFHMGEDEELQAVAIKYGVLWQRPDLIHLHNHWGRARGQAEDRPAFLDRANTPEEWRKYKQLFAARQTAGFPGSEPL